jgi:hypothetical protein
MRPAAVVSGGMEAEATAEGGSVTKRLEVYP